jgi:hypothetical protein
VSRRHRGDRRVRRGAELVASVGDRAVLFDLDGDPALGTQVGEVARLVLEATLADDVELRILADGSLDESGDGGAFQLGQMLAGEEGYEVRGGVDGSTVDAIHALQP